MPKLFGFSIDDSAGIQEFTVELQVQWWEAVKGTGANAGGEDIN